MDERRCFLSYIKYFILFMLGVFSGLHLSQILKLNEGCRYLTTVSPSASDITSRGFYKEKHDRNSSVVFVGGYPRSGTTLMRVLLDAHPDFYCGQETHVIPNLLSLQHKYSRGRPLKRIKEAGLPLGFVNRTIAETIFTILRYRNKKSPRLCNKDPFTLKYIPYLSQMFPNAQFVLVVRDARAVLHSVHMSKVKITNFPKNAEDAFKRWSISVKLMLDGCIHVGPTRCMLVQYENLVIQPRSSMENILRFLGTDWNESVLKHTQFLNTSGGIAVSSIEKSTDQVRQPIHQNSLYSWQSTSLNIPREQLMNLAPMMKTLGYMDIGQPPRYERLRQTFSLG